MGVTVHFEGKLRGEDAYLSLVAAVRSFATQRGWPIQPFEISETLLRRVRDEKDWDYRGPTKGIELCPHPSSESIRLEFDDQLYIQEYTKTQFAPVQVHMDLILLLRELAPYFEHLGVFDEGEYFESANERVLKSHLNRCFEVLDERLANDRSLRGPVRLPSGRIADLVSDA